MKGDRERCLEAGMDGYVAKPVQKQELFDVIAAAVPAPRKAEERRTPRTNEGAAVAQVRDA